jgi:hypothetical protein
MKKIMIITFKKFKAEVSPQIISREFDGDIITELLKLKDEGWSMEDIKRLKVTEIK